MIKKIITLIIIVVAGYFAYQHFFAIPSSEKPSTIEMETISESDLPPMPESCKGRAKDYENGVYGQLTGQASVSQRNLASRNLANCLQKEGFSEAEIRGTLAKIEKKARGWAKGD